MQRPKGTKDYFGKEQSLREFVYLTVSEISRSYQFKKIETPIFEQKSVFSRAVGETSDIVSKEMYEFKDKAQREMVLRPEGTAGVIRAIVENKTYADSQLNKLFYFGPMFRYENTQKGRMRQFTQFGVEYLSEKHPLHDGEIILLANTIFQTFGIKTKLVINSIGDKNTRDEYSKKLKEYLEPFKDQLSDISKERLNKNPLRILDDKVDGQKDFVLKAPTIADFYSKESSDYFNELKSFLKNMDVEFEIDHKMVRGLDYYNETIFEFVSTSTTASNSTLLAGGRYDNLVKSFGGPEISGVGFGMGVERVINDIENQDDLVDGYYDPEVYVGNMSEKLIAASLGVAEMLRRYGIKTESAIMPSKIQKIFKNSEKLNSKILIIMGDKDFAEDVVTVKMGREQEKVKLDNLLDYIDGKLNEEHNDENA